MQRTKKRDRHRTACVWTWGPLTVVSCRCRIDFFGRDDSEAHRLHARHEVQHSGTVTFGGVA